MTDKQKTIARLQEIAYNNARAHKEAETLARHYLQAAKHESESEKREVFYKGFQKAQKDMITTERKVLFALTMLEGYTSKEETKEFAVTLN